MSEKNKQQVESEKKDDVLVVEHAPRLIGGVTVKTRIAAGVKKPVE